MNEQPQPAQEASWEQIQPHLDAGIQALPAKLREAVVRFYLQNRSRSDVARELGVPEGTVASRVSAGLEKLRRWYAGLGITATGAGFALLLSSQAQAAVPPSLVASLPGLAAGGAAASAAPAVAKGILAEMVRIKLTMVAAGVCMAAAVAAGGGLLVHSRTATPPSTVATIPGSWSALALPGVGKSVAPQGGRQLRAAYNPDNGRIYFCGGRYTGTPYTDSARNEVYSYSIADNDWRLEYAYRGPKGEVQPSHPASVGWTYDTRRKIFWMIPGGTEEPTERELKEEGATLVHRRIMTFDPARRQWNLPAAKMPRLWVKFAQYDPVKDQIVTFGFDGGKRLHSLVYDIASDEWIETQHWKDPSGRFVAESRLDAEFSAIDAEGRAMWLIEPLKGELLRFDLDRRILTYVGPTPVRNSSPGTGGGWPYDSALPVWDPVGRVLLWPHIQNAEEAAVTLYAYRPDSGTWEKRPTEGQIVGNCAVFDPRQRALLLIGGSRQRSKQLFLYR